MPDPAPGTAQFRDTVHPEPDARFEALLDRFCRYLGDRMGLDFQSARRRDLEQGLAIAAKELGFPDASSCMTRFLSDAFGREQIEYLAGLLTIGETYFFRDHHLFDALETRVLPALIRARSAAGRRLLLWSAGGATGEEAYSLAIVLARLIPDLASWNVAILATDINPRFIEKAAGGVYGSWSFRQAPDWLQGRYFIRRADGQYEVIPAIRDLVVFSYHNLADNEPPPFPNGASVADLILCRNVLMYFSPESARKAALVFHRSLSEDGWLAVSPAETSRTLFSGFRSVTVANAIFYRKDAEKPVAETEGKETKRDGRVTRDAGQEWTDEGRETSDAIAVSPAVPGSEEERHASPVAEKEQSGAERNDPDPVAIALAARSAADQGRLVEANDWCDRAIAADKTNPGLHYLRAIILQGRDRLDEAAQSLRRVLFLDPRFVLAHFLLGDIARRQRRWKAANKHFENAGLLLRAGNPEELLPGAEGMTARGLLEIIETIEKTLVRR